MSKQEDIKEIMARDQLKTFPLRGKIIKQKDSEVWIREAQRTWVVRKEDIENIEVLKTVEKKNDPKLACLFIKDGAEIYQILPTTIDLKKTPITLTDPRVLPSVSGIELILSPPRVKVGGLDEWLKYSECTPWTTTCWVDENVLQADDSQCDWIDY